MIYNFDNLVFQLLTVDRFSHQRGTFNVKARPYASFSFRISGTGRFEIGSKSFVSKPGDLLFLPANTPYKVEYSVSESIVIHFEQCNYSEIENISMKSSAKIAPRFEHLLQVWNETHSINSAKSIIYDIFAKTESDQKELITDTVVEACIRYMEEHYGDQALDIRTLCDISFISPSSLQRAFAKSLAMSPNQYLIRLRMNRALELLTKNELSVKEISFACGFADEKYFSRAFKNRYGFPPSHLKYNMIV